MDNLPLFSSDASVIFHLTATRMNVTLELATKQVITSSDNLACASRAGGLPGRAYIKIASTEPLVPRLLGTGIIQACKGKRGARFKRLELKMSWAIGNQLGGSLGLKPAKKKPGASIGNGASSPSTKYGLITQFVQKCLPFRTSEVITAGTSSQRPCSGGRDGSCGAGEHGGVPLRCPAPLCSRCAQQRPLLRARTRHVPLLLPDTSSSSGHENFQAS